jgi:hypothetical protein
VAENDDTEPQPEAEPQPEDGSPGAQGEAPQPDPAPGPEPAAQASVPPQGEPARPQVPEQRRPEQPQPAFPQPQQPAYPQPAYPQPAYSPQPGYAAYPPPAAPARPKGEPLIRLSELVPAAVDAVVPLAAGLLAVVLGLLLVVGVGLSGVSVQGAGAGDYFAAASWLTASSLGTPFGGGFTESIGGIGSDSFTSTEAITARAVVWLVTVLILFLAFRGARRRERREHSRSLTQLVARSVLPAVLTSVVLLVLALTTQRANVFGTGNLLGGDVGDEAGSGVSINQSGRFGIDTPLVFVGPLLIVLLFTVLARVSVWIQAPESLNDPRARGLGTQWDLWRPSARVAWLQLRIIVTLSSIAAWFYVAVQAGNDSNSADHPLVFVLAALVLILNLGLYGMFAGFGVTLYATASAFGGGLSGDSGSGGSGGLSGSGFTPYTGSSAGGAYSSTVSVTADSAGSGGNYALGILNGSKPWELWILLAIVVIGTAAPAVLARTRRPRKRPLLAQDYAPAGAWRAVLLGLATALVLILLGALEMNDAFSTGDGLGGFGTTVGFGPSLPAGMGLTALWFLLAYLAVSFAFGHRIHWRAAVGAGDPAAGAPAGYAGAPYPPQQPYEQQQYQQYAQQYPEAYQQPYPAAPGASGAPVPPLPPPPAAVPVETVATVAPDEGPLGAVEPLDPSESPSHVVFPDEEDTLGDG